jgi:hypothetical protein
VNQSFGHDLIPAVAWWKSQLTNYKPAFDQFEKAYLPDSRLTSKEFALRYVNQRTDNNYPRDMTLLPPYLMQRDVNFNCLPLMFYILEKGYATFPSCLDVDRRPDLHSSVCLSICHQGGPYIAYVFKRSEQELNSLVFGGVYGMILAKCIIKPEEASVQWFGAEAAEGVKAQGPRILKDHHYVVEKMANYLLQAREKLIEHVSACQFSDLPPLCLVGHYKNIGHYIWNELALIGLLDHLPLPLHIAVGEYDFADFYFSKTNSVKVILTRVQMNGVFRSLNQDHVYISPQPLIILKDIFALGKKYVKDAVKAHLDIIASPSGNLSDYIQLAEKSMIVVIGLRLQAFRRFNSTSEFMQILDSIFVQHQLDIFYYLDGYSIRPSRPYKSTNNLTPEHASVKELLRSLPEAVMHKCLPYVVPTIADKRQLFNRSLCGFYPIGSGLLLPGWLTELTTFSFDGGKLFHQLAEQDFICNSAKDNCFFLKPSFFKTEDDNSFSIADASALKEYLEIHIADLLKARNA